MSVPSRRSAWDQDHQPLLAALRQRERQVEDMLNCLRQAEAARGDYDRACQALDLAADSVRKAEIVFRDAQAQEQEERDNLLEEFTRRREQNTQLEIPQDIWLEIRSALTRYHTPADWSPIRNQLDECVRRCESVVQQKRIQADGALSALQKEYTELEYHLRQNQEPARARATPTGIGPSRPPATDAARSPLRTAV